MANENAKWTVVRLTVSGVDRVLNGHEGMTFIVSEFTEQMLGLKPLAHVRDYRYGDTAERWQTWTLSGADYEVVE